MLIKDGSPTSRTAQLSRSQEQEVIHDIHRAIAERRLLPGAKLSEEALAEIFQISRARVRRVLLLLAKENIVQLEPNRGAFVWRPSVQDARNVLQARRIVELETIRSAAMNAKTSQISELRRIVAEEKKAIVEGDYSRSMRLSGEFHMALARCANNPILTEFLSGLISRCYLILATYQKRDVHVCPQNDHSAMIDCIERRDAEAAVAAQSAHSDHIEHELDLADKPMVSLTLKQIFGDSKQDG